MAENVVKHDDLESMRDTIQWIADNTGSLPDAKKRMVEGDAELRRGLVALNGAGLIAIAGPLAARLPPAVVHDGAWSFAWGLAATLGGWLFGEVVVASAVVLHRHAERAKEWLSLSDDEALTKLNDRRNAESVDWVRQAKSYYYGVAWVSVLLNFVGLGFFGWSVWLILNSLALE